MGRRHSRIQALEFCERLRSGRPDMVFGADLIAGFPTETEAQFENTLALVDDCALTYLHVFPYSERTGTPAARMPQVPGNERRRRAGLLREKGFAVLQTYLAKRVNGTASVLIERLGLGRDEQDRPVHPAGSARADRRAGRGSAPRLVVGKLRRQRLFVER